MSKDKGKIANAKTKAKKMNKNYVAMLNEFTDKLLDKENKEFKIKDYVEALLVFFSTTPSEIFEDTKKNIKTTVNNDVKAYRDEKVAAMNDTLAVIEEQEAIYNEDTADESVLESEQAQEEESQSDEISSEFVDDNNSNDVAENQETEEEYSDYSSVNSY